MFRQAEAFARLCVPSPHARGDVPPRRAALSGFLDFSPRPWGCSVTWAVCHQRHALLPTPVGMFRAAPDRLSQNFASPHARGDVPGRLEDVIGEHRFSPRPWGCSASTFWNPCQGVLLPTPVGMFRWPALTHSGPFASPHARGDVPRLITPVVRGTSFSPRPWGCSVLRDRRPGADRLLPTPVGMFQTSSSDCNRGRTSPHARGDVPTPEVGTEDVSDFSPRPWGCSVLAPAVVELVDLLPTPVGMFQPGDHVGVAGEPSPHARGDVPPCGQLV